MLNSRIYKSKVYLWLFLLVMGSCVFLSGAAIYSILYEGINNPASLTLSLSSIFFIAIVFGLAYPVSYEITQSDLIIRSGLTKSSIELSTIESVKPSRNPLSSPAWSLDRLRIDYRKKGKLKFMLISPEDRSAFLNELVLTTNNLSLQGDKITILSHQ